ncbi:hypothetical protein M426DRAFT_195632 [Hypoxylon sp. CI-4A]|nr:hypothetical protein M426DRAFT_195632 [Hypoxylon sp. CI-4A]
MAFQAQGQRGELVGTYSDIFRGQGRRDTDVLSFFSSALVWPMIPPSSSCCTGVQYYVCIIGISCIFFRLGRVWRLWYSALLGRELLFIDTCLVLHRSQINYERLSCCICYSQCLYVCIYLLIIQA